MREGLLHFNEYGAGPPLLLVHGLMVTGEMFAPVIEQFASRHRVIVPDLRGHGQSRGLPPPYTASHLAADLAHLLEYLEIDTTDVLGYSQGGAIAQQLALDYSDVCEHLVLACTYAFNATSLREKLEGRLVPLLIRGLGMPRFARLAVSQGAKELPKERADWLAGLMGSQDRTLMLSGWKETVAFDSRRRLGEITCPTLVVAGSADNAVPMHHARMLHDGIHRSRLVVVEGAGHTLVWSHPDDLVRATETFLAS